MRVRIHRGATEIGGSCVELEYAGHRLILDLGKPLGAGWNDDVPLPNVPGLADGGDPLLHGIAISHSHADHWGLVPQVHSTVPRYIGKASADILRAASFWGLGTDLAETGHLRDSEPLHLGPFTVTPYLVDHSAYDAYALLVQAGKSRLFYTGDIRGHGRKAAAFQRLLNDPPPDVDVLLMEGTNIRPAGELIDKPLATESDVEADLANTLQDADGLVVVIGSPQNVDRMVTVYRAALRANRDLVVDAYGADIAGATGNPNIPRPGDEWSRVHAYLPLRQRVRIKDAGEFGRAEALKPYRIFPERLAATPGRFVLYGSYASEIQALSNTGVLRKDGVVVWSLWDGYLAEPSGKRLQAQLAAASIPFIEHHTSGHASSEDLASLVAALNPTRVVPIHTEHPASYAAIAPDVQAHADGDWWVVGQGSRR